MKDKVELLNGHIILSKRMYNFLYTLLGEVVGVSILLFSFEAQYSLKEYLDESILGIFAILWIYFIFFTVMYNWFKKANYCA